MIVIPNEKIRKYVSYSAEEGEWIHDPQMPKELEEEFLKFKKRAEENSHAAIKIEHLD